MSLFIGIMSGTSLDGIDLVIVDFQQSKIKLVAHSTTPYDPSLKQQIEQAVNSESFSLDKLCQLDRQIAKAYASATLTLLKHNSIHPKDILAIGCHGQTIKHNPNIEHGYTLQIGDPNTLAALTNITVVADFRRKDIALGGQGAPLVPAFHQLAFQSPDINRIIVNIGGIANISVLPSVQSNQPIIGFDTGPGNTILDHFCLKYFSLPFDTNGDIATKGSVNFELLDTIFEEEPYFSLPVPKSTGTDYFNLQWFEGYLSQQDLELSLEDQLATLTELSAQSIHQSILSLAIAPDEIYYCGGGQHNKLLMNRLQLLTLQKSQSTEHLNIHPDWVEAIAFAWFAKNTFENKPSNMPSVTSASRFSVLGGIFNA